MLQGGARVGEPGEAQLCRLRELLGRGGAVPGEALLELGLVGLQRLVELGEIEAGACEQRPQFLAELLAEFPAHLYAGLQERGALSILDSIDRGSRLRR